MCHGALADGARASPFGVQMSVGKELELRRHRLRIKGRERNAAHNLQINTSGTISTQQAAHWSLLPSLPLVDVLQ